MTNKKPNVLSRLLNKLVWLLSIFVIFFVLFISVIKFSLPYLTSKKETIIHFMEDYVGGDLDYQSLRVDWAGFYPQIKVEQLTWLSKSRVEVSVKNMEAEINLWKTLSSGQLATEFINADGVTIELASLDFSKPNRERNTEDNNFPGFDIKRYFQKLAINQDLFQHEAVSVNDVSVSWFNREKNYKQKISFLNYKHVKNKQQLVMESDGDVFHNMRLVIEGISTPNTFLKDLKTYIKIEKANLNFLLLKEHYSEHKVIAWINFYEQQLSGSNIQLSAYNENALGITMDADVLSENNNFYIKTNNLQINSEGSDELVSSHLELLIKNYATKNNNQNAYLKAFNINLSALLPLLQSFYEFEDVSLNTLNVNGWLNHATANVSNTEKGVITNFVHLDVKDFKIAQEGVIPQIELDKILLEGVDNKWAYSIQSENTQILYKPLFKGLIPISSLDAKGHFLLEKNFILNVEHLNFKNKDAVAYARGSIRFDNDSVFLNLVAEANNVNVKNLDRYWPRDGSMNENTLEFLDKGLVSGRAPYGRFVLRGDIAAYPYAQFDGLLDVRAKAENVTLKFLPNWPAGRDIDANFNLVNHEIRIDGNKGQLKGVQIKKSHAYFPDIMPSDPELKLSFNALSNNNSFKKLYNETPLKNILGETVGNIEFSGDLPVALEVGLLLADETDFSIKGKIDFDGQNIRKLPYNLAVENTKGSVFFDDNGAYTQSLSGLFFDSPLDIDVLVDSYTENDSLVKVNAKSNLDLSELTKKILSYEIPYVSGKSEVYFFYEIDKSELANESLVLRSQLQGTEITGPEWLAKKAPDKKPLLITALKKGDSFDTNVSYSRSLSSKIKFNLKDVDKTSGQVLLGDIATAKIKAPKTGVAIEGYFDRIHVKEWIETFSKGNVSGVSLHNTDSQYSMKLPKWVSHINITTPKLVAAGQEFTNVRLNDVALSTDEVRFNLFSEQARASLAFGKNGSKLLDIERLDLALKPWKPISDGSDETDINIKYYDNWTVKCQTCFVDGYDIGNLVLKSSLVEDAINISGELFISQFLQAKIDAHLTQQNSKLKVDYQIPSPGGLLQHWKLKGEMEDTKTYGTLDISWQGLLHDFELEKINGAFSLTGEKGAIINLSDKKARIFSLFSLESIPRRLSLDFSDLFKEGFYYDSIIGSFDIKEGILLSKEVSIDGTAADVSVSGQVDLVNQTVNQRVTVVPQLGSSLPVLAGWAIEPTTGLVMFLVSKIFEPALSVVSQIEYQIVGSIDDPKVIELSKTSKEIEVDQALIEKEKERIESEKKTMSDKDSPKKTDDDG